MKRVSLFIFLFIFINLPALRARAEPLAPKNRIRIECQMVILPQAETLALLPDLQDDTKIEAAWSRIQSMIRDGTATLVANLVGQSAFSTRAQVECVEEMRYGTEFEPPQLPYPIPHEKTAETLKAWPFIGLPPLSFETRNVGQTLEIEVTKEEQSEALWANVVAQHTRFLRWEQLEAGRLADGDRLKVAQPIFHTMKSQEHFPLASGHRVLLSTHRVPDSDKPAFELFILRVELQNAAAMPTKPRGGKR